ncbi:hypothetical protein ACVIDN_000521 [Rhizobium brockwellii]
MNSDRPDQSARSLELGTAQIIPYIEGMMITVLKNG